MNEHFSLYDLEGTWQRDFSIIGDLMQNNVFSGNEYFLPTKNKLIHYHPFIDSLYFIQDGQIESLPLNFEGLFYPYSNHQNSDPLTKLEMMNKFEGYFRLANGIKLLEDRLLFTIMYKRKLHYLQVDLLEKKAYLQSEIKNDLAALSSRILFSGNNEKYAWYYSSYGDLMDFYRRNSDKIPEEARLVKEGDEEGNPVVLILRYKQRSLVQGKD